MDGEVYWLEQVVGDVWTVWYAGLELFEVDVWMVRHTDLNCL